MIEWTTGALSGRVSCPDPGSLGRVEVAVLAAEDQRCHAPQRCALASPPELPVAIVLAHKTFGRAERSWSSGQTLAATSSIALGQLTRLDALVPPMFSLVISNVPGPTHSKYLAGAKLGSLYPISLLMRGGALNIPSSPSTA